MNQQSKPTAVLIVDDDKRIRHIIKNQLKSAGYIIFEAGTAKQAIKILNMEKVDMIVCDIKMKEADGFEFIRQLKEHTPTLPVIILTGFIEKEYALKARELGCFAFLIKPVKREKLIRVLERAVGGE